MPGIIEANRSIVLAADIEPEAFEPLMAKMEGVEGLGGVKVGFELGLGLGLRTVTEIVRGANRDLAVIYDHQKAANDIPPTGMNFARAMVRGQVDAAILFPFTGPVTQRSWTEALLDSGIKVISGGEMTHPQIASTPDGTAEGYVHPAAFERMYSTAVDLGVRDFVVPGNKPDKVAKYKSLFDGLVGEGDYALWAPGFVDQGGDVSETGALAGPNFYPIVGGGIYKAENPHEAAQQLGRKLLETIA